MQSSLMILLTKLHIAVMTLSTPAFIISATTPEGPAAFPLLIFPCFILSKSAGE